MFNKIKNFLNLKKDELFGEINKNTDKLLKYLDEDFFKKIEELSIIASKRINRLKEIGISLDKSDIKEIEIIYINLVANKEKILKGIELLNKNIEEYKKIGINNDIKNHYIGNLELVKKRLEMNLVSINKTLKNYETIMKFFKN